ncbi:hypothetical protein N182_34050 [Sinorhizobium sp. GL2]|nr:hypothetical protein N182_34050 [Sinorhizobium sp. GL2]
MDKALVSGLAVVPEAVMDELDKKSKDAHAWLKQRSEAIVGYETTIQQEAKLILAAHPKLVMVKKVSFAADPFVIATAAVRGLAVVSEEGPGSPAKPHIPDVCRQKNVECMRLIAMIRAQAWVIG